MQLDLTGLELPNSIASKRGSSSPKRLVLVLRFAASTTLDFSNSLFLLTRLNEFFLSF